MELKSSLAGLMAGTIILCHYIDLEVLYLWWIQVLFPVCMSQILFQCMTFRFTLFMMSFKELKFLILMESDLLVLSLWVVPLCLILKSVSYPPWSHELFCGVLAPEIFTDSLRCITEENTHSDPSLPLQIYACFSSHFSVPCLEFLHICSYS